ncbi:DNA helicase/exodeoxyribonuclease V, alpha subunit [Desulfacinum infernum DSM 9756]|uniref:DNA helicase/exodeoxyribonuclease V, alpha subunit n=1 Tax=Desulfacinum infernum DSM 9756 TaxID=1121391 RepID=A0A1M5AFY4_9BACT|nr:exodeoxyribonuclease V subunit alpha [Desulfacinum infernum]SHF29075.1 DNA helicase/exodeoxyribonuclease V, alpha subunit [Desulfacinum infernum DSM 9756]
MILERLKELARKGVLRRLDWQFARWVGRISGDESEPVLLAAALVSLRVAEGDVCVDLAQYAGKPLFGDPSGEDGAVSAPPLDPWIQALSRSPAVSTPPDMASTGHSSLVTHHSLTPLVLDGTRLYLARYRAFEEDLARRLLELAEGWTDVDPARLRPHLDRLFPAPSSPDEVDWQRAAAAVAALKRLCIISGGPGTGKTHTVTAILALLHALQPDRPPRIALAAPTGKAAVRITESIQKAAGSLQPDALPGKELTRAAVTLHRLIGIREGRSIPRHNPENPLHVDVLVIDEASMIDLPLMARTVAALPSHARLILLGDKDQLASVEAGSVFADLCGRGRTPAYSELWRWKMEEAAGIRLPFDFHGPPPHASPLDDCTVFLQKSYRFDAQSGIGRLAAAVRTGSDVASVLEPDPPDHKLPSEGVRMRNVPASRVPLEVRERALDHHRRLLDSGHIHRALERMDSFRILCALREGPAGVKAVNAAVEEALGVGGAGDRGRPRHYKGRPVLITQNDYQVQLFNGDVGLIWPDPDDEGRLCAWFRLADGSLRKVRPLRLPPHETAFAMTVHKAQGSEFQRVLFILPEDDSPVLTRELVYTAVTRAKESVEIWGSEQILRLAASRATARTSGLYDRLFARASGS